MNGLNGPYVVQRQRQKLTSWFAIGQMIGTEFVELDPPLTFSVLYEAERSATRLNNAWWAGRESLIVSHGLDVER